MNGARVFIGGLLRLPLIWQVWVSILMVINGVIPFYYLGHLEAQVTVVVFAICATIGMSLAHVYGFTKLLGVMHFPWFLLIPWLVTRLGGLEMDSYFSEWVKAVIAVNATTLIIDVNDVVRYARGERDPS